MLIRKINFLLLIFAFFWLCCKCEVTDFDGVWDDSGNETSNSAEEDEDDGTSSRRTAAEFRNTFTSRAHEYDVTSSRRIAEKFRAHRQPTERWPDDFYRLMTACRNGSVPGKVYTLEGKVQCPGGIVAVGRYQNNQNISGWGILEVETFAGFPAEMQAFAAGLVEGQLTKVQIGWHYENTMADHCTNEKEYCRNLFHYLGDNLDWIREMVQSQPPTDLYWRQVNLTFHQLTGISDGYGAVKTGGFLARANFRITPVYLLQLAGDLIDLVHVFNRTSKVGTTQPGHCSALVKVTPGNGDLLVSHNTMSGFHTMNRVLKLYKFAYGGKEVPGKIVTFSGYPAALQSGDDFTLTSAGLLSLETTIDVFDYQLYWTRVKSRQQLHCWLRAYIANQLTTSCHDWVKLFARYNSGTYNNQWMVIDYKLFKPGQPLPGTDLFWILEQMPGTTVSRDVTWFLNKYGHWPSYNIPFLSKISELSGYSLKGNTNNWWRWGHSPRARIFQRDQGTVHDMDSLRLLMRYNDFKHDEFSKCDCQPNPYSANAAISTRGDLNPMNGTWEVDEMGDHNFGSIDYKGTNYTLFKQLRFDVIGGPTFGGPGNLPFFSWKTTDIKAPHWGQPRDWKFEHFVTQWQTLISTDKDGTRK